MGESKASTVLLIVVVIIDVIAFGFAVAAEQGGVLLRWFQTQILSTHTFSQVRRISRMGNCFIHYNLVGIHHCRDYGVNFFGNAKVYANGRAEEIMGQAMKELGWKRSDLVVSTKLFWGGPGPNDKGLSRKHIVEGTGASLTRLGMDYVDVMFCHRPDTSTPIEEMVRAMNYVIDNGWAFYWGASEWNVQQITEAWEVAKRLGMVGHSCEQPEYNLFSRHKVAVEYAPLYNNYGLGLTTWSPLSSGVLTRKYSKGNVPQDSRFALDNYKNLASRSLVDDVLRKVDGLKPIAAELDVPLAQLAIAWCASNPNVSTVITGAIEESQIHENVKALDVIPKLNADVLNLLSKAKQNDQNHIGSLILELIISWPHFSKCVSHSIFHGQFYRLAFKCMH